MMNSRYQTLKDLIETKNAKVGIIGLGYVGLPLAMQMVKAGYSVYGIDINDQKLASLQNGKSYIHDVSDEELQEANDSGRFFLTSDYQALKWLDAVTICVPTPLSKNQDPDTSYIHLVVEQLKQYMQNGPLITLESTTYPGTTEELIQRELEKIGLRTGIDYFLCFSPERVDPSNRTYNTYNTPKVIGGTTAACLELGSLLYQSVVKEVVPVSSPKVAEMSKLLENTFRSVNIAFINEMAMMCEKMGIDIWEVIKAASTKPFGFMPFYPGPGIGGHCIPLDPMYLSWKAKGFRFYSKFIDLAQAFNTNMPDHVIHKTAQILNLYTKSIKNSRVLLLGMAYKPGVDDVRESPGLAAYELFKANGAFVDYCDPFATSFADMDGNTVKSIPCELSLIRKYDCIVVITNHKEFDYEELAKTGVPILDTRNAFDGIEQPHIYKLGAPLDVQFPAQLQMA
ncbi:UDP-N-acetyl-D-glucosamine 6-dehydrogenase [Paenibacillus sp. CECT 9249]|nr:UDP-N-acetyl-D-glucosamine 6-dehydrogenase [Paenibacillus sp. CECT 9249]